MHPEDHAWMAYIDGEVRAVCEAKGWGHQIRRKWSVREKPVVESTIADYEWKLLPDAHGRLPDAPDGDFDGVYYVVSFDSSNDRFIFQHDTSHGGAMGPHWEVETYSEIRPSPLMARVIAVEQGVPRDHPSEGWLRDHLLRLIASFGPNYFSVT